MATKQQWKLEVDLKSQAESVVNRAEKFRDAHLDPAKMKENPALVKRFDKALKDIKETSKIINLGSGTDMRSIIKQYHELSSALEELTKRTGELTAEQIKASERVNIAEKALSDAQDKKRRLTKDKVKIGEGYGLSIKGFAQEYEKSFRIKTAGLNERKGAKNTTIGYETLLKKVQDENWVKEHKDIVDAFHSWRNAIIQSITQQINIAEQDVQAAKQERISAKRAFAIEENKTPVGKAYKNVVKGISEASDTVTAQVESKHDFNIAQNTADNDKQIQALTASITKQQTALGRAFKQFTLYAVALRTAKKAVRMAIDTIGQLDKSLTEQAMVTGKTREETYGLLKSYQDLAAQVGSTTKEVASVATEYMKQGETVENALVLTKAAVSAAKVARVSVGDSVNYLTTALKGFHMEAEQAMTVSDKFAKLAAASATDYDELAIALSKVASQAHNAGMSMDYTLALLTKGLETTREAPETMGTALKTIIARMRELSDYGATLEGDTDVNNVESQLAYVGIALRDTNGELRSTEEVLDELGRKWDTLNSNQQAALAKALAGTRWRTRLWRVQRSAKNYLSKSSWIVGTTLKTSLLTIGGNTQWGKRNDLDIVKRWSI